MAASRRVHSTRPRRATAIHLTAQALPGKRADSCKYSLESVMPADA